MRAVPARIEVVLSGEAPSYPLTVPFTLTGTVDSADYVIAADEIVIESGVTGYLDVELPEDFQAESDETLIVTLQSGLNAGVKARHTITVTETNVEPTIDIQLSQQGQVVSAIARDAGEVTVSIQITDPKPC